MLLISLFISPNQSAFFKGRLLVDRVVVVNEFVDLAKKSKKYCLIFKMDFEKAYDSLRWSFLHNMFSRFELNDKWRSWICVCVFSGNITVLVHVGQETPYIRGGELWVLEK